MNAFVRFMLPAFVTTSLVIIPIREPAAIGQEQQGCFLVDAFGDFIELDDFCPRPEPFILPSVGEEELGTGDVQVTLLWASVDDLDLAVTSPNGVKVFWENPVSTSSGGTLDRDSNSECAVLTTTPLENIFWPTELAPSGDYVVEVELFERCAPGQEAINFELRIVTQGAMDTVQGTVDDANPTFTHTFSFAPVSLPEASEN